MRLGVGGLDGSLIAALSRTATSRSKGFWQRSLLDPGCEPFVYSPLSAAVSHQPIDNRRDSREIPVGPHVSFSLKPSSTANARKGFARLADNDVEFSILTDEEFLSMVADKDAPEEFDKALLEMRREGRIQIFDDGSGEPLIVKLEQTN